MIAASGAIVTSNGVEPTDDEVLRWVCDHRIRAGLHFDDAYERQRIQTHREDLKRAADAAMDAVDWRQLYQRVCEVAVSNLARAEHAEAETKRLADGIMRCVDAGWRPHEARNWSRPELVLAEYVGELRARIHE